MIKLISASRSNKSIKCTWLPVGAASIFLSWVSSANIFPAIFRWCWPGIRRGLQPPPVSPEGLSPSPLQQDQAISFVLAHTAKYPAYVLHSIQDLNEHVELMLCFRFPGVASQREVSKLNPKPWAFEINNWHPCLWKFMGLSKQVASYCHLWVFHSPVYSVGIFESLQLRLNQPSVTRLPLLSITPGYAQPRRWDKYIHPPCTSCWPPGLHVQVRLHPKGIWGWTQHPAQAPASHVPWGSFYLVWRKSFTGRSSVSISLLNQCVN